MKMEIKEVEVKKKPGRDIYTRRSTNMSEIKTWKIPEFLKADKKIWSAINSKGSFTFSSNIFCLS